MVCRSTSALGPSIIFPFPLKTHALTLNPLSRGYHCASQTRKSGRANVDYHRRAISTSHEEHNHWFDFTTSLSYRTNSNDTPNFSSNR